MVVLRLTGWLSNNAVSTAETNRTSARGSEDELRFMFPWQRIVSIKINLRIITVGEDHTLNTRRYLDLTGGSNMTLEKITQLVTSLFFLV